MRRRASGVLGHGEVDHTFVREVIRASSVITLTEDVHVDAHDYGRRHYVASRREWSRDYASAPWAKRSFGALHFGVLPLTYRLELGSTLGAPG